MKAETEVHLCQEEGCDLLPRARLNDSDSPYLYCPTHGAEKVKPVPIANITEARWAYEQAKVLGRVA